MRQQQLVALALRQRRRRTARRGAALTFLFSLALLTGGGGAVALDRLDYYSADLPDPSNLNPENLSQATRILDRKGRLLYLQQPQGRIRTVVPLAAVSPLLRHATVDIEDRNFYLHQGLDYARLVSAAYSDARGASLQGGSTITQQLAKLKYFTNGQTSVADRTIDRKAKEALLAQEIEARYGKDQILEAYLNEIFYGHDSYGIEAASETYFGVHASDLDLNQASLLAGIPQQPSKFDPLTADGLAAARRRQREVLDAMARQGDILPEQVQTTLDTPLAFRQQTSDQVFLAPHFVVYLLNYLKQKFGATVLDRGGLVVTTSLDLDLQNRAQQIVHDQVARFGFDGINNGAMVALDPTTGQILAYVGSADYNNQAIDGAYDNVDGGGDPGYIGRQPGSSFKPYVYLTALQNGWSPGSLVDDRQGKYAGSQFFDFDNGSEGVISVRTALVGSRNIPPIQLFAQLGYDRILQTVRTLGIATPLDDNLGTAIGGSNIRMLEHADAYAAFAAGGVYRPVAPLLKVTDTRGNVLYQFKPTAGTRVASPQATYELNDILLGYPRKWGLNLVGPTAGKSGTTGGGSVNPTDNWYMGYTPDLVVGTWMAKTGPCNPGDTVRRQCGLASKNVFGVETSEKIFQDFLPVFYNGRQIPTFQRPAGIVNGYVPCHPAPPVSIEAPSGAILPQVCTPGDIHVAGLSAPLPSPSPDSGGG
ncbi:MAG TPA: transglycosylase domain-containing protein [Candidatus Dormibacteraeota bacterium]|jgi:membrane peptidoglycan carboxypeptidase|nr:transglycosylase domain-containing protein [Candidatus Dormibacteraeota bacterium]